jgi:ABC-type Fe3+-hydroxamate transport system substrate-binding protein
MSGYQEIAASGSDGRTVKIPSALPKVAIFLAPPELEINALALHYWPLSKALPGIARHAR